MSDDDKSPKQIRLQLVRDQANAKPEFCNNFVIQADGPEFHIRFYQLLPPIIIGETEEDRIQEAERLEGKITATCVSHIVFSRDRMIEFVALIDSYAKSKLTEDSVASDSDEQPHVG